MIEVVRRYVPRPEARALIDELRPVSEEEPPATNGQPTNGEPANSQPPPETN